MKFIARKPVVRTEVYRKYGFTYVEHNQSTGGCYWKQMGDGKLYCHAQLKGDEINEFV